MTGPRSTEQRRQDALYRLGHDVDAWVATTDTDTGAPRLTPLSFLWHDETLLFSTSATSPTARNLAANPSVQVGVGLTRDVVLVQGTVETLPAISDELGDAFAAKSRLRPAHPVRPPTRTSGSRPARSRCGARRTSWPAGGSCAGGCGSS